jgi:hypothetical protein
MVAVAIKIWKDHTLSLNLWNGAESSGKESSQLLVWQGAIFRVLTITTVIKDNKCRNQGLKFLLLVYGPYLDLDPYNKSRIRIREDLKVPMDPDPEH